MVVLVSLWVGMSSTFAQNSEHTVPDFALCFKILAKNRTIYNEYNDSIFLITEHDKWVNFFRHRAIKNHQIFAANQETLRTLKDFVDHSKGNEGYYAKAYRDFFDAFQKEYILVGKSDPFMILEIAKYFDNYNSNPYCPDSLNFTCSFELWRYDSYNQLFNLTKDTTYLRKSYACLNKVLLPRYANTYNFRYYYSYALYYLTNMRFLRYHVITLEEYWEHVKSYRRFLARADIHDWLDERQYRIFVYHSQMLEEDLIRNVYMADTTSLDKSVADSIMASIVKRKLVDPKLSYSSYLRVLMMQIQLGQISAKEALAKGLDRYEEERRLLKKTSLRNDEFSVFLQPYLNLLFINDEAEISSALKRRNVLRFCRDIEMAYRKRNDNQNSNLYVSTLSTLVTYHRLTKYLTPKERIHFLNSLCVATQISTYAHSVHVAELAETLMEGILKYQPELLVGTLGDSCVSEILHQKKKYLSYIHDAAMYHDLGKNSICSVVNNDYRPLTDTEFSIIKLHPELGLKYLELAPELAKFHDTTLGHHKWYNGKGGYPSTFDNTKSPVRLMIDVVTLSDCLQAATEHLGRNYKMDKTIDVVIQEFRQDAGTRYNPDLVALIDAHEDVRDALAYLIEEGWLDIYYHIYTSYLHPHAFMGNLVKIKK